MKRNLQRRNTILLAATAALSTMLLAQSANAQYATGQDGHANDANNRVGSGGYNTGRNGGGGAYTANDIVNHNVTGGKSFTGPINERDPRAFAGPIPSGIDAINRASNLPPPTGGQATFQTQTYYGDSRFTAPPAGAIPDGFTGGYIGTRLNTPSSLSSSLNTTSISDTGLQARTMDRDTLLFNSSLTPSAYITATPGSQEAPFSSIYGLRNVSNVAGNLAPITQDVYGADDQAIIKMRQELRDSAVPLSINAALQNQLNQQGQPAQPAVQPGQTPQQPAGLNHPLNSNVGQPFDAPANPALRNTLSNPQIANAPLSSTGVIPADAGKPPSLIPIEQQSDLLRTLQDRLKDSSEMGKLMVENQQQTQQQNAPKALVNSTGTPTAQPGNAPGAVKTPARDQAPVPVSSLATGIKAKGLHDLLAGAEDLMRQGKYDSAIKKYDQAHRVAANNPLPPLGRAHASLAAGYYAQADHDLRVVFHSDPELLLAKFDLAAVLPKDRIDFIRKDLQGLAQSDARAARPWFLLAYLDYNTGDAPAAEKDLDQAEQRAGRGDWAIRLLREHWALPNPVKPAPRMTPRPAPAPAPAAAPARAPVPAAAPAPARSPAPAAAPAPTAPARAPVAPAPAPAAPVRAPAPAAAPAPAPTPAPGRDLNK